MIDWLLKGDASIKRMVREDLLETLTPYSEKGYIQNYLSYFDPTTRLFDKGVYTPKWTSTFYTCLELTNLRIDPSNTIYQMACDQLYQSIWVENCIYKDHTKRDVCIIGMLLKMLSYQTSSKTDLHDIIDYLLNTQMSDGGWNCRHHNPVKPKTSSLHTTINVLEGFAMYIDKGYTYKIDEIKSVREQAHDFILQKNLFRSRRTNKIIHPQMAKFHYPNRWKYDCYRALDYFQAIKYPYDYRMKEALDNLKKSLDKGYINRGTQYPGKVFFALETSKKGRFTTLQALRILKFYDPKDYQQRLFAEISHR